MDIQTHYLQDVNAAMQQAIQQGKNWMVFDGRPIMMNANYLKFFASAEDARKDAGIDFSIPTHQRAVLLKPIADAIQQYNALKESGQLRFGHVISIDIDKIINDERQQRPRATLELTKTENPFEKNTIELGKQLQAMGFPESLLTPLKQAIEKGEREFMLIHKERIDQKEVAATLHFRETLPGDRYVLDRFNAFLQKSQQPDPIKHTFYQQAHQANFTFPEATRLLDGRPIAKALWNTPEGPAKAWLQLDFKNVNRRGEFAITMSTSYDINKVLSHKPIVELENPTSRAMVISALERGERPLVTFAQNGRQVKAHIEASPRMNTLQYYSPSQQKTNYLQIKTALETGLEKSVGNNLSQQQSQSEKRSRKMSI